MTLAGALSTAVLTLSLGIGIPAYAQQDQHDQQEDKDKAPQDKDKKAEPEKSAKPEEAKQVEARPEEARPQDAKQEDKKPEEKNAQPVKSEQKEQHAGGGRIPADRFKANFGREHSFRVSQGDYQNHRFQYGGYSFGFASAWPSNWLYTQDVYVVEINGVYYLCNATYPGVNVTLTLTL
jgi:hypothetical protein